MQLMEEAIIKRGKVLAGDVLKVDCFLNHLIDVDLLSKVGKYVYDKFADAKVDKILTVEASGIGFACITAQYFHCPVLFAKKSKTTNLGDDTMYSAVAKSYTHLGEVNNFKVSKNYLLKGENVLIMDDFLATGEASRALVELVKQAGGNVVGIVNAIEKGYQGGGDGLRKQGYNVESLAIIDKMDKDGIVFRK